MHGTTIRNKELTYYPYRQLGRVDYNTCSPKEV